MATSPSELNESTGRPLTLRVTDQETARVVAIHRRDGQIVGAGCLLDQLHIVTCSHVVRSALGLGHMPDGQRIYVTLLGLTPPRTFDTRVLKVEKGFGPQNDLALLEMIDVPDVAIPMVEFASPLRHSGKSYSVLGFPGGERQGRNVIGTLHAADANGLVQMDRGSSLSVLGGFSGAPVWSPDVSAFVGIVVTELSSAGVAWCIPSRRICEFFPNLRVRFRIPASDRPVINDWQVDDPNVALFGTTSDDGTRRLTAKIRRTGDRTFRVDLTYQHLQPDPPPRGQVVTFITYPDFKRDSADAYELFADLKNGIAEQEIYGVYDFFTVAAISDAGDTALTLDLAAQYKKQRSVKKNVKKR